MNMDPSHELIAQELAQTSTAQLHRAGNHALFRSGSSQQIDMEYQLVDKVTDIVYALNEIRKHDCISVDCEGVNLSKEGDLCLLPPQPDEASLLSVRHQDDGQTGFRIWPGRTAVLSCIVDLASLIDMKHRSKPVADQTNYERSIQNLAQCHNFVS